MFYRMLGKEYLTPEKGLRQEEVLLALNGNIIRENSPHVSE